MRTVTAIGVLAVSCLAVLGGLNPADGEDGRFAWMSDLDQARAMAASQDKPLLIVFRCEP